MNIYLNLTLRCAVIVGAFAGVRYCQHRSIAKKIEALPVPTKPALVKAA